MSFRSRMSTALRALPIRQKLGLAFVLTMVLALLLAGLGILTADTVLFYRYLERDLSAFVQILGSNSSGALAFDDPATGREVLAPLQSKPHVVTACLYQPGGQQLALYSRQGYSGSCPIPEAEGVKRSGATLVASHVIRREGRQLGSLALVYDLEEIQERLMLYGLVLILAELLASIVAWRFSAKLRALIAEPLVELAHAANAVSRSKDYDIRVSTFSEDEVGNVANAFNHMLDSIKSRDENLRKALDGQLEVSGRLAEVNRDLTHSNRELARSNQDLEHFAFAASHDLQEPLRMITTYSQLLVALQPANGDRRKAQYAEYIVSGTRRMRELLTDLLAYTEIAGLSEQPTEAVDLDSVVMKVWDGLSARVEETGAELTAGHLPAVAGQENRFTSLFMNLISNAIKYRGERPPRVRIWAEENGTEILFSVADNGIGIAKEYHNRIFDAFKRLHGKEIPGTGIGLAICQRIVERYGGRIWVESESGSGAIFRFSLPKSIIASDIEEKWNL